jgi:magnesium-transporting ATPase (P-type)
VPFAWPVFLEERHDGSNVTVKCWHSLEESECLRALDAGRNGLSREEAARRLAHYGPNRLQPPRTRSPLVRFLEQFNNVLIYILLAAGAITAALGHWVDSGVIFGVVIINAFIGFLQEGKAERAMDAIRNMLSPSAMVLRDRRYREIPAEQLVPGDLVQLQAGDRVPADLRLLQVRDLRIDEAALTGESVPVDKQLSLVAEAAVVADRVNMAWSGTMVTYGKGAGIVVATGTHTQVGHISDLLGSVHALTTPLLRQIARFGRVLTTAILALAAITFLFGVLVHGETLDEMFLAAVALAVAAIPEGLPAIISITLAIGVQTMARRNVIIRRLPAVETLGSVTVICSDKTGTLTHNEMAVTRVITAGYDLTVTGAGYEPRGEFFEQGEPVDIKAYPGVREVLRAGLLCNDAELERDGDDQWLPQGDTMDAALLALARKAGMDDAFERAEWPRDDNIPFDSSHRFMVTLHHDHAGHGFMYVKGAPERLFAMCSHERYAGEDRPIHLDFWHRKQRELGEQGQRVLAVAFRTVEDHCRSVTFSDVEQGLTLLGLYGFTDPPREDARQAVAACGAAGIRVKMITGDHATTARAIATQLGIHGDKGVLTGEQLEAMGDLALQQAVSEIDVFARASPEHKLRLVQALQHRGQVTAMTGDGVNDAPALKRADVGVAMGRKGTEAAKEAAEMVITDDNFASIVGGVEEGRTVYDNIRKSILFILPTNGAEALVIIAAVILGRMLPITPVQILWVNMITAVTLALSLAFEPAERNVMQRAPRRPDEPLLSGLLVERILLVSVLMVIGTFGLFIHARMQGASLELARTIAVNTLVVGEAFYLFNTRYLKASSLNVGVLTGNRYALAATAIVLFFQLLFTYATPMQTLFHTESIDALHWLQIFGIGLAVFLLVEAEKAWLLRRWR